MSTDKDMSGGALAKLDQLHPSNEAPKTLRPTSGVGNFGAFTPITSLTIPKSRYQHMQRVGRWMKAEKRRR